MKYLFIGGPADGRRDEVADWQHTIQVMAMNESPFSFVADKMSLSDVDYREVRDYLYYRRRLLGNDVFIYHGISGEEAIRTLIRRYPQPL